MLELSEVQTELLAFCKKHHGDQVRKYTGEPYWHHLVSVAEIVSTYEPDGLEIALCHDLLEDTSCTEEMLGNFLRKDLQYSEEKSQLILQGVVDLTDVYISEAYPDLNRKARKKKEAERLGNISPLSQSVKYADLIDNASSIVEPDPGFGRVFIREMLDILDLMRAGNIHLLVRCCWSWKNAHEQLQRQIS